MVHAIDDAARRFYQRFQFDPSPVDPFQLMLLLKDIRKALRWTARPATTALAAPAFIPAEGVTACPRRMLN